jgi:hypothetical protein
MMQQGQGGITGPQQVAVGGSITVKVEGAVSEVRVTGGGKSVTYPVVNGTATVQAPPDVAAGQSFWVLAGKSKETKYLRVEVIEN